MKLTRILAYASACVTLTSSFLVYMGYIHLLGFPDGFITELAYAERRLALIFIGTNIVLGACFVYLGTVASRKNVGKKLAVAIFIYLIFLISVSLIDYYYHIHLMGSAGG